MSMSQSDAPKEDKPGIGRKAKVKKVLRPKQSHGK
jgi:hypothetical protein